MSDGQPRYRVGLLSQPADFYGGGQRSLRDIACALRRTPFEPLVLLPGPGPLATTMEKEGIAWLTVPLAPVRRSFGRCAMRTLRNLIAIVRDHSIDLLHSDSPRGALYAGLASRLTGRRHVWHLRASLPSSTLSDRMLLSLSDAAIGVSRAAAGRSKALRASDKVRVIHTGIEPVDLLSRGAARKALGLPPAPFIAAVIGRVEEEKGRDEAVAALPALRGERPGAMLALLGPVEENDPWAQALSMRVAATGHAGSIVMLGAHPEAARLLSAFDLIMHPSHHEALPRVLIEALLAGIPVVASSVGGVPEVIEADRCGLLVPARDPGALAAAAARLAGDPELCRRLALAGRRRARTHFSVAAMASAITSTYEEVLRSDHLSATDLSGRTA